jgi:hypothetical protein
MGEHINTDEATTKIAIVSVAAFLETCGKSLDDLSKTGIGPAGATHLQSIRSMVSQCAMSLRSYASAHKSYTPPELDSLFNTEKIKDELEKDDAFLAAEQEQELAKLMGFIEEEVDGLLN